MPIITNIETSAQNFIFSKKTISCNMIKKMPKLYYIFKVSRNRKKIC